MHLNLMVFYYSPYSSCKPDEEELYICNVLPYVSAQNSEIPFFVFQLRNKPKILNQRYYWRNFNKSQVNSELIFWISDVLW